MLGAIAALLGVVYAAILLITLLGWVGVDVPRGSLILVGFEPGRSGSFASTAEPNRLHMVAQALPVVSHRDYDVRFDVTASLDVPVQVFVDIEGGGFDGPEAEKRFFLEPGDSFEVRAALHVGEAPPNAMLRIFYSGPPGLEVSNVRGRLLPSWLGRTLAWSGWACGLFAGLAGVLVLLDDRSRAWSRTRELSMSLATGRLLVVGFYAIAVFARFALYRATPYWSGDEYWYKAIAAGIWEYGGNGILQSVQIGAPVDQPHALYPHLIAPAFALGDDFYTGIRLINAVVMNSAVFPAYAIARRYWEPLWAVPLAAFSLCVPGLGLGAFAATEALFYPIFMTAAWAVVRALPRPGAWAPQLWVGVLAAAAVNARPTGAALLPVYLLATVCFAFARGEMRGLARKPGWVVALVAFAVVYASLQFLLRGEESAALGRYGVILEDRAHVLLQALRADPASPVRLVLGHLLTLSVPYAFPLTALVVAAPAARRLFRDRPDELALAIVAATAVAVMVGMTLAFTVVVSTIDLGGLDRWHSRYYFVSYPLLVMGGALVARRLDGEPAGIRWMVVAGMSAIVAAGGAVLFWSPIPQATWFGSIVDNMDVQWELYWPGLFVLFAAVMIVASISWAARRRVGLRLFVAGLVVWVAVASAGVLRNSRLGEPNPAVACGRALAGLVSSSTSRFGVFGRSHGEMVGLGFWLSRSPSISRVIGGATTIDEVLAGHERLDLILTNGDLTPPHDGRVVLESGTCRAYVLEP